LQQLDEVTDLKVKVDARKVGEGLAVHVRHTGGMEFDTARFSVSHIQTGLAVIAGLAEDEALAVAEELKDLDWAFDAPAAMPEETRRKAGAIVRRLRKQAAL
jgi:hypothetical protein